MEVTLYVQYMIGMETSLFALSDLFFQVFLFYLTDELAYTEPIKVDFNEY